jgi:hypothetical protein
LESFSSITASNLIATVYNTPHLHLYQSNIPDSSVKLYLVLDDRPITRAIQTSTLLTGLLLLMLLALSIFALHRVLRIQLIEPLDHLRAIMGSGESMPDEVIEQLGHTLPSEAGDILGTYDELVHAEHDMAQRFHEMLDRVPGCVWSASSDLQYIEVSTRATQVFNSPVRSRALSSGHGFLINNSVRKTLKDYARPSGHMLRHWKWPTALESMARSNGSEKTSICTIRRIWRPD